MNWICPNPNITRIYISLKFSAWVNEYPPVGLINKLFSEDYLSGMTIEQIKKETESLSFSQQRELAAFLVQLRNRQNHDGVGRALEVKIIGAHAVTFWADHAAKEIKVIQVQLTDGVLTELNDVGIQITCSGFPKNFQFVLALTVRLL